MSTPQLAPDPNIQELRQLQEALNMTDVGITIAGTPDPVAAGGLLTYTLTTDNFGPNPASQVQISLALPAAVTYQRDTGGCVQEPCGTFTCNLGEILARQNRQLSVTVRVGVISDAGTLATIASVTNFAGPDPKPENNSTTVETRVTR